MKNTIKQISFLTIYLLNSIADVYARAGGGSGSGGGGRSIFGLIAVIIFFSLLYYRTRQSKRQILISEKRDRNWNYEYLIRLVRNSFMRVQDAWMKKDLSPIENLMTENLRTDLQAKINRLNFFNEINVLEDIEIKSIKIVGCEDYLGKDQDTFTAYIYGSMVDYSISGLSGHITSNSSKLNEKFRDLYYFKRHGDTWLVDRIDNDVDINNLYHAKHVIE